MSDAGYVRANRSGVGSFLTPDKPAAPPPRSLETLFAAGSQTFARARIGLRSRSRLLDGECRTQLLQTLREPWTLNDTGFFRDAASFDLLRKRILPELIERRRHERRLRIWSAASSTGQEAYSVAMVLLEHFPELEGWDVKVIGTDLRASAIEQAMRGRYRRREVECGLTAAIRDKYFRLMGDAWEAEPRLRALCEFRQGDLCAKLPELPSFDVVLLRNVLLYLAPEQRSGVFATIQRRMHAEGYLLLDNTGQAEDWTELFEAEFAEECPLYRPAAA